MNANELVINDGGRAAAGFGSSKSSRDCVVRAIAIATEIPYKEVFNELSCMASKAKLIRERISPSKGVHKNVFRAYMKLLGWRWVPTMGIGTGCTVHLKADELPSGRLVVCTSRHLVAVIDGVINDKFNPSRGGTRCVYGYFKKEQ